jgi:hypothetical protein
MDLHGAKAQNGPRWAWARTGALILFLLSGVLLLASLTSARSQHANGGASPAAVAGHAGLYVERS